MMLRLKLHYVDLILLLTAFAAGTVDVISFAMLGGVFASAMTGNFALLAYYVAQGESQAAMGSVVALTGFVLGCGLGVLQRRSRAQAQALAFLLTTEGGLLFFFALYALWVPHVANAPPDHLQILLLAVAMGVQAVIGQTISQTTIVFTTTLTKLVGTIADSLANGDALGLKARVPHPRFRSNAAREAGCPPACVGCSRHWRTRCTMVSMRTMPLACVRAIDSRARAAALNKYPPIRSTSGCRAVPA